jgi:hypothetical protein
MIEPVIVCKKCQLRIEYGQEINDPDTTWCPYCDDCKRIITTEQRNEAQTVLYLSEKCITYDGMTGSPSIRFLPSQVLNEDAELMAMIDLVYFEKMKIQSDRIKLDKANKKKNGRDN